MIATMHRRKPDQQGLQKGGPEFHRAVSKPHKERRARAEARETTKHANRDTQYATRLLGKFRGCLIFSSEARRYQVRYSLAGA